MRFPWGVDQNTYAHIYFLTAWVNAGWQQSSLVINPERGAAMLENDTGIITRIYACFNARDIDGVLAWLSKDVAWANGMDGGHVHGHQALRDYWTRQWAVVSPHVAPVAFRQASDAVMAVDVIQTVYDLNGQPLTESHGLEDKTVAHLFHIVDGKITRFDIEDERQDEHPIAASQK